MEKTIENKTITLLRIHFYGSIIVLAILFLLVFLKVINFTGLSATINVAAERYAIGTTLIAIPVALKLFADIVKKIPKKTHKHQAIGAYKNAYFLRLYIINVVALGNILLFAVSGNSNFMWLAVVSFVVFAFCQPSQSELGDITTEEPEKTN